MDRRRQPNGRAPGVGHALHAVGLSQGRDLLAFGDAAGRADVRLNDIHGPALKDLAKAELGELVLPPGHRHVEAARDLGVAPEILGGDRLLEPVHPQLLQLPADVGSLAGR